MSNAFYQSASAFIKNLYSDKTIIPLHEPSFTSTDKRYLSDVIDSTYVSSAGEYINEFESKILEYTSAKKAVAVVNGTAALHLALVTAGVSSKDLVITQSLTFVATVNAIKYQGATPLFIDVSKERMSLCPNKLNYYLDKNTFLNNHGIQTSIHYKPIHNLKFYEKPNFKLKNLDKISNHILSLPIHPKLIPVDQKYIIDNIKYFINKNK